MRPDTVLELIDDSCNHHQEPVEPLQCALAASIESTTPAAPPTLVPNAVVGRIVGWSKAEGPLVEFPGSRTAGGVAARSLVRCNQDCCGAEVALVFESGDLSRPLILGVVQPSQPPLPGHAHGQHEHALLGGVECQIDNERLVLTADREIVLRCGSASITLTSAGKVLIRGKYVVSRASGTNRVQGGSVQIN